MLIRAILTSAVTLTATAAFAECESITLDGDTYIDGEAPADGVLCYTFDTLPSNNLSIQVTRGENTAVTVPGYYDARSDRMFMAGLPETLEVRVFQVMRAAEPEPFTVVIRLEPPGNG
ncbi:MAG: hypothetical protein VX874_13165 [Pseudomonadota bacterium]|nr:hypothetical protein [Pseudomonadota bacterium]